MFLDASAIIALLLEKPGCDNLERRIEAHGGHFYFSQIARIAAVTAIGGASVEQARQIVDELLTELSAREISVQGDVGTKALHAWATYGKASGHPAALELSDCYSYGCAKAYRIPLLTLIDGFAQTDLS